MDILLAANVVQRDRNRNYLGKITRKLKWNSFSVKQHGQSPSHTTFLFTSITNLTKPNYLRGTKDTASTSNTDLKHLKRAPFINTSEASEYIGLRTLRTAQNPEIGSASAPLTSVRLGSANASPIASAYFIGAAFARDERKKRTAWFCVCVRKLCQMELIRRISPYF